MTEDNLPLLQGTLDILVLKALVHEPRHGYAVARWIRETTHGTLQIEEGALYTALHRMEKRGWVESTWGLSENNRRAKFYGLTTAGEQELRKESRAWVRYADAVSKVLRAPVLRTGSGAALAAGPGGSLTPETGGREGAP